MIQTTNKGLGIARVLEEFTKTNVGVDTQSDANTALGMLEREGMGKIQHIDVGILWLQQKWLHTSI